MAFNKEKCYICQAEFPDKTTVMKHIRNRHPDHVGNRVWETYTKMDDVSKIETQTDVVKSVTGLRDSAKVIESVTKEVKELNTKNTIQDKKVREVMNSNKNNSKSDDAKEDDSNKQIKNGENKN